MFSILLHFLTIASCHLHFYIMHLHVDTGVQNDFVICMRLYAVWLGSGAHDLASSAKAVSFLCLGRVFDHCCISFLPRSSFIKVRFKIFISDLEMFLLSRSLEHSNVIINVVII